MSKKITNTYMWVLVIIIVFALLSYYNVLNNIDGFFILALRFILKLTLAILICTLVHELGHLIAGLINGYSFISFSVLFFKFYIEDKKIRFRIDKFRTFFGYCAMLTRYNSAIKYLWYISNGIIFNLLFALILIYVNNSITVPSAFIRTLIIVSLYLAFSSSIPVKLKNHNYTDGWTIWAILFDKDKQESIISDLKVSETAVSKKRPRNFNLEIDKSKEYSVPYYIQAFFQALDSDDLESAVYCSSKIEENFDIVNEAIFNRFCYIICFTSCLTGDFEKAKNYYKKCEIEAENDNDCNGLRVRAYYEYYVNNRIEYAYELCKQGIDVVDEFPIKGQHKMEEYLLEKLIEKIENTTKQPTQQHTNTH